MVLFVALPAQAQEVNVDVEVEAHVRVRTDTPVQVVEQPASRSSPTFAMMLQGGLQGVPDEFSPGFGMELGAQLAFGRTRVGLIGGYHTNAGLFSDSRSEVSLSLELQRVFTVDPMFRPYGFLGAGVAFASVTPESDDWDPWEESDPVEEQGRTERRMIARIGAGIEVGPADGFSLQLQAAALVRGAPGRSSPAAIRVGGQFSIGLRMAL